MSSQDDARPGVEVVDLGDRTGGGSPAANQSKTEPMPPTAGHDEPDAAAEPAAVDPPDLDSMNVGAADPQAPSHPAAGPAGDRAASGLPVEEALPSPGSDDGSGVIESVETDVETSAARTNVIGSPGTTSGAGDAASVPVVSAEKAPGTSQESAVAQGAKTPE